VTRLRAEGGWTLVELLLAMTLMLLVLTATLATLSRFEGNEAVQQKQNDSQDAARQAIDLLSRRLRNLADPRPPTAVSQGPTIDLATSTDLVFRTVNSVGPNTGANTGNVSRVRYCQGSGSPSTLFFQVQTWTSTDPPPVPSLTACPGSGWDSTTVVAHDVRNSSTASPRPIFSYGMTTGALLSTVPSGDRGEIVSVRPRLFVDVNPGKLPAEVETVTSIFLRNQNRPPVAEFTPTVSGQTVVLNAAASSDPEEQPLKFSWTEGSTVLGQGLVLTLTGLARGSSHTYTLRVDDPDGLTDAATATVSIP
jgi:type II secretory pathway pseudopilin PulG